MYLWVVLATFITILYSFNLAIRPDMDRAYAETKASVVLTKFRAQHNAVKDYLNSQAPAKTGQSRVTYYPGSGYNVTAEGEASNLSAESLRDYLPVGYQLEAADGDAGSSLVSSNMVTKVFCFSEGNTAEQCLSGGDGSCCSDSCIDDDNCVGIYVVSFKPLPSRWLNKTNGRPNADMLGAMAKIRGFGKNFGYTDTIDGKVVLSGGRMVQEFDEAGNPVGDRNFEYLEIYEAIKNDTDFNNLDCGNSHCIFAIQQIYA